MVHFQFGDPAVFFGDVEDDPGHENRGEHAYRYAEEQGHGKSLDLLGSYGVEHDGRDQMRDVAVDDRGAGPLEGVANGHPQGRPAGEFFAQTFENQHVVVHGHTHRQGKARKTGK